MLRGFPLRSFTKGTSAVRSVLSNYKFVNPDIGPINEALEIDYFIISSPKCGTTAIQRGLERLGHKAIHAHTNISTWEAFSNGAILRKASIGMENILAARLAESPRPVHIFFGYRAPVSWYISLAGHTGLNLDTALADNIIPNLYSSYPWNKYSIDDISTIIREGADLDILNFAFDNNRGYTHIRKNNINLILYRFDRIENILDYIINNINKGFVLTRERVNENPAYVAYISGFKAPKDALEQIDCDRWFQHFYTPAERAALIRTYARRNYLTGGTRSRTLYWSGLQRP